jgi:hypothetical protein
MKMATNFLELLFGIKQPQPSKAEGVTFEQFKAWTEQQKNQAPNNSPIPPLSASPIPNPPFNSEDAKPKNDLEFKLPARVAAQEIANWLVKYKSACVMAIIAVFLQQILIIFNKMLGYASIIIAVTYFGYLLLTINNEINRLKLKYNF